MSSVDKPDNVPVPSKPKHRATKTAKTRRRVGGKRRGGGRWGGYRRTRRRCMRARAENTLERQKKPPLSKDRAKPFFL